MQTSREAVLAAIFCVLVIFLAWWWWPSPEPAQPTPMPMPAPGNVANRPNAMPANAENADFREVTTTEGEKGYSASLSTDQGARLKKGEVLTIRAPGGGVITVAPLEDSTKK